MPVSREEYAKQIIVRINQLAGPTTEFGRTLSRAKQEYADCHQAYSEAAAKRSKAPTMKMPVNIVPRKSFRAARRSRYSTAVTVVKDSVGGWQLSIEEDSNISGRPEFYKLSWKEEDGTTWEIAPLPLSDDVVLANNTTKCFLYFDKCGLDVRDADGNTLGTRAPLASKKAKTITLPISMIFLAMSVVSLDGALTFVEHWEDVTQSVFADEVMSEHSPDTSKQLEGSLPVEFFDKYSSCRSLLFPAKVLKLKATWDQMKSKAQPGLPAQPSDLLWLLEQFFSEIAPNGGHWDPVSTSEHPTYSVYTKLMNFACRPKYKHHPHNITLKAMAHLSEQGQDDRRVPYNMLLLAGEFLRPGGKMSKKKNLRRTLPNGDKIDTTRFFRELPAGPAKSSVVARVKLPKIEKTEDGLGHVSDETVDSSGDDSDDDSDGDSDGDASLVLAGKTSRGGSTRASSRDAGFAGRGSGRSNDSTAGRTDRKSPSGGASDADRGDSKGTYKKRRTGKDDHYSARKSEGTKRRKPDDDGDEKEDPASKTARTGMDKKIRRTRAV
ncbi:hypothetical protein C7974DRAFT_149879 [Boeremia exigua]|uniref:uncharacterized protein n=1 Tax=Boeremia exigua TaxID=749465 RepID=UPI001E8E44E3|nr:uncharacterized protein C7974DRAFT_149879 [Boeremia exigua]KAH6637891.1 hypothetical protein C7974DRAFT_149879 [Boeremia exigua]